MATLCTRAWVHGLVQGVGFRYRTRREAEALGLTGFARNLDDGSVEILACGEESNVAALVRWLQAGGPKGARVDKVLLQPSQPREIPEDFTTGWQ